MKVNFKHVIVLAVSVAFSNVAFNQKTNVTSAVLEYQKYNMFSGDMQANQNALNNAKKFIDLAAEHPDTKEDEKMLYYKGLIYYCMTEIAAMDQKNVPDEKVLEQNYLTAKESLMKAYNGPKGKYKSDVVEFTDQRAGMAFEMAMKLYKDSSYEIASQMFAGAYEIKQLIGVENAEAKSNAILCMKYVVNSCLDKKDYDKAVTFVKGFEEAFPKSIEPLTTMANVYLNKQDNVNAEIYLNKAIAIEPNNKDLFYVIGSIYMDLKQNEKAEENLRKSLAIDPNYTEAQYQLGAHLYNWAAEYRSEAFKLEPNDKREAELIAKSNEKMSKAIEVLDKYIEKNPNDKVVLQILFETNYKTGNKDKAMEYKKRLDALK
ncbi:MAG: tetratricopeptide repeat protein [Flavobacteriia bacterium]|jgi:tetratricopeptide (TPR) repeat protein